MSKRHKVTGIGKRKSDSRLVGKLAFLNAIRDKPNTIKALYRIARQVDGGNQMLGNQFRHLLDRCRSEIEYLAKVA